MTDTDPEADDTGVWVWTTRFGHTYKGTKGEMLAAIKASGSLGPTVYEETGENTQHICGPEDEPWWSRLDWLGDTELLMDDGVTVGDWRNNDVVILAELKALVDRELRRRPEQSLMRLKVKLETSA